MLSATLDTSVAQNFLSIDEQPDSAVVELIALALRGRVSLAVSEEAHQEVARTPDPDLRQNRLVRLQAFDCPRLPPHRNDARDKLAADLHSAVFPEAVPTTRQDEHNLRDCRQMAAHRFIGREIFVTRDTTLLKRRQNAESLGVHVVSPQELVERIVSEVEVREVDAQPAISVRDADLPADEPDVRRVLGPLASDYPSFDAWLTRRLRDTRGTRIRLGEYDGRIGAVSLSAHKDDRVVKLSAFYVAEDARDAGLGGHLLWSELRTWVREGTQKTYVTVSSRHADLIEFFAGFGFLVEGISPRRYQEETAEFVLAKHLPRVRVDDSTLDDFADRIAGAVFKTPTHMHVPPTHWTLHPDAQRPALRWDGRPPDVELVAQIAEKELRRWRLLDLERIFHPARFALEGRRALLVPIERRWADALVEYAAQQRALMGSPQSEKLLLRAENAYYCYPKAMAAAQVGSPILFYVKEPIGAVIGEARVFEASLDEPEELYLRYGGLGIYELNHIRRHVMTRGPNAGKALALRFGLYVPFPELVPRQTMFAAMGRTLSGPQGLTTISFKEFEAIRRIGGIDW